MARHNYIQGNYPNLSSQANYICGSTNTDRGVILRSSIALGDNNVVTSPSMYRMIFSGMYRHLSLALRKSRFTHLYTLLINQKEMIYP